MMNQVHYDGTSARAQSKRTEIFANLSQNAATKVQ